MQYKPLEENTDLQLSIVYLVFSHPRQSIQTLTPPSSPESISGLLRSQVPTVPPQGANGTIVRVPSATTTLKINTTHQTVTAHTSLLPRLVQVLKCQPTTSEVIIADSKPDEPPKTLVFRSPLLYDPTILPPRPRSFKLLQLSSTAWQLLPAKQLWSSCRFRH